MTRLGPLLSIAAALAAAGCFAESSSDPGGPPIDACPRDAAGGADSAMAMADAAAPGSPDGPGAADGPERPDGTAGGPDGGVVVGAPDGMPAFPPEIDGQITINEVMVANAATVMDDTGLPSDWVELYNPTDRDIDLCGYHITDDLMVPAKSTFAAGLVAPAGGRVVIWLDERPSLGPTHAGVDLAREGGELGLSRPDGSWIDRVTYGEQEVDFSAAREPDGSDNWRIEWLASPGDPNPANGGAPAPVEVTSDPPEAIPAAGDLSEEILGYDLIPSFALDVSPADVAKLLADPRTYVPAMLTYGGRSYGPIGVRLKGNNSFEPFDAKPSLRLNIDQYLPGAKFFGLKDMTLDNMASDFSMMHERLAYLMARRNGVPASRANHALLTVNGTFYGLYMNVETVKKALLRRWFTDDGGSLFEGTDADFTAGDVAAFELETGPDDRSLITGAATALTLASPSAAIAAAGEYVDMAAFQRFWALESLVGQFDAFPYSNPGDDYFVYADPTSGRLHFMPWGIDESFYSSALDVTIVHSVLAVACSAVPDCFTSYSDAVWDMLDDSDELDLEAERIRVAAQIAPYVALDLRKPYTNEIVTEYQKQLGFFIRDRRMRLGAMLPARSSP